MARIPVRDQVGGTCYAYTAVGVADAWRESHENPDATAISLSSGLAAAVGSGVRSYRSQIDGGHVCKVVSYLRTKGGCDQTLIPEKGINGQSLSDLTKLIESDHRSYQALRKQWVGNGDAVAEARDAAVATIFTRLQTYGYPKDSQPTRDELARALDQTKRIEITRVALVKNACLNSRFEMDIPACNIDWAFLWPDWMVQNRIDSLLTRKNAQPVAISFCANVLVKGRAYNAEPFRLAALAGQTPQEEDCGGHAALVIGKRASPKTGSLQYLIRNSWGTSCKYYSTEWDCDGGNIWVDAAALIPTVYSMAVLE